VILTIPAGLTDDNDFMDCFNLLISSLANQETPGDLWIIRINNWFDHKWLGFSGLGTTAKFRYPGPINLRDTLVGRFFDTVKVEFSQDNLTFPPFTPARITEQWSFRRSGLNYIEAALPKLPHRTKKSPSRFNLHRRIEDHGKPVLFLWFSGNTLRNGRGCAMVYSLKTSEPVYWYASFRRNERWIVEKTKGIDQEEVTRMMAGGPSPK
jgi:hypothetical protein